MLQGKESWVLFLLSLFIYGILGIISPQVGGDTAFYLQLAKDIAGGNLGTLKYWPLHWLYSGCLSIGYILVPGYFMIFVRVFNIFVAALIPLLFYKISRLITGLDRMSFLVSLAVVFYPSFLFWSRYILTDTFFLMVLLWHILSVLTLLNKPKSTRALAGLILSSLAVLFSRPTSLPVLLISTGFILFHRWGKKAMLFLALGIVVCTVLLLGIPAAREKILSLPSVYQSLWLSTRLSSTDIEALTEAYKFEDEIPPGMSEAEFKLNSFKDFVIRHPVEYAGVCLKKFAAYFYPWVWAKWALYHKILDALLSIFLTVIAFYAVLDRRINSYKYYFLLFALGFCLLTVFGQIDSDGRYRLPAELCILLLLPLIIASWRGDKGFRGRVFAGFNFDL